MTRRVGVEEEFLIVDGANGHPVALGQVMQRVSEYPNLSSEMKQEQIETCTLPRLTLAEISQDIVAGRRNADALARLAGARAVALATSPLPVDSTVAPGERCGQLMARYGLTAVEQLTCGCHVHVEIESDEEGAAILDRIRIWLPVLQAIASNSPFWNGNDSGYAGYRSQAWNRWPTTGPSGIFGSAAAYHAHVRQILGSGVPLDKASLYFDARLSDRHPTVEVRIADVCLFADDAVLVAALVRALAETAARQWRDGVSPAPVPTAQVRLASWQASRFGLESDLIHPALGEPRPASDVLSALLDYVRPVLAEQGELETVELLLFQVMARGTGAVAQREVFARTGSLAAMIAQAIHSTALPAMAHHRQDDQAPEPNPALATPDPNPAPPDPVRGQAPDHGQGTAVLDNQPL
ncbi:glutamate--cysteine ligase [Arthrobacter sp. ISL-85]|uniref:glutamate--cysteine ligase n=1 Tax=Arthrobacter sp. ISL-85 TaxID=2819115 RepID=UPI001BE64F1B|nr:glutamate--cysteine ligase [Arthrobacter sp. ISL-85]MBT2567210.1 glutamate--cysteine ligase [Arthrobacter sp. ISL-85]